MLLLQINKLISNKTGFEFNVVSGLGTSSMLLILLSRMDDCYSELILTTEFQRPDLYRISKQKHFKRQ